GRELVAARAARREVAEVLGTCRRQERGQGEKRKTKDRGALHVATSGGRGAAARRSRYHGRRAGRKQVAFPRLGEVRPQPLGEARRGGGERAAARGGGGVGEAPRPRRPRRGLVGVVQLTEPLLHARRGLAQLRAALAQEVREQLRRVAQALVPDAQRMHARRL